MTRIITPKDSPPKKHIFQSQLQPGHVSWDVPIVRSQRRGSLGHAIHGTGPENFSTATDGVPKSVSFPPDTGSSADTATITVPCETASKGFIITMVPSTGEKKLQNVVPSSQVGSISSDVPSWSSAIGQRTPSRPILVPEQAESEAPVVNNVFDRPLEQPISDSTLPLTPQTLPIPRSRPEDDLAGSPSSISPSIAIPSGVIPTTTMTTSMTRSITITSPAIVGSFVSTGIAPSSCVENMSQVDTSPLLSPVESPGPGERKQLVTIQEEPEEALQTEDAVPQYIPSAAIPVPSVSPAHTPSDMDDGQDVQDQHRRRSAHHSQFQLEPIAEHAELGSESPSAGTQDEPIEGWKPPDGSLDNDDNSMSPETTV